MNHQYVEQHNIADRYLMRQLSAQEREQFEAHYFDCELCLRRLEVTEKFRRGLQQLSAEEVAGLRAAESGHAVGRWDWLRPRRPMVIALAALVLLVLLPVMFLLREVSRTRRDLEQARAAAAQWQRQSEIEQQAARAWEEKFQQAEQTIAQLQAQSGREVPPPSRTGQGSRSMSQPQINTPIFDLVALRGHESGAPGVSNEIVLTPTTNWFLVTLGLELDLQYATYRATILARDNRLIWRAGGLRPSQDNELTIGFPGGFFEPGEYFLRLDGLTSSGQTATVATYSFRLIKANR